MCGIHAVVSVKGAAPDRVSGALKRSLQNRGPDHLGHISRTLQLRRGADGCDSPVCHLSFTSTVLALRGDHIARQPLHDESDDGSVLCWNGEAWRFDGDPVSGNDAEQLFSQLGRDNASTIARQEYVLDVFRGIQGPFAVVYYDAVDRRVYFGRDRLGRRSLLVHKAGDGSAVSFSSIAGEPVSEWAEVTADGLYSLKLDSLTDTLKYDEIVEKHDWSESDPDVNMVSNVGIFNVETEKPQDFDRHVVEADLVEKLEEQLVASLRLRVVNVPEPPREHAYVGNDGDDVRVAVLFSGGLDCTVLARLAHKLIPSSRGLDLINVAFENPRLVAQYLKQPQDARTTDFYETCPDRITGRKAFSEVKQACPDRAFRFIAVNVPFQEAMANKATVVSLIYPHDTEMDLSIAFALYFAARGTGHCYADSHEWEPSPLTVTTPARVLLSGLGADELFGGYARHDIAYKRQGYSALVEELKLDVGRIGQRNLGRDDRVMTHWGKEVRFPFLDEEVVRFAIGCPVWTKCDFGEPEHETGIEPAKRILRLVADRNGLLLAAREKKRAIQFGSRTAKMESSSGRVKGTASIAQTVGQA